MKRTHRVTQHRSGIPGVEAMTLFSDHVFPRHSHDHFGIGIMTPGAQRSWSLVGHVESEAGDVIMCNPGEMHDGMPLEPGTRNREPRGLADSVFRSGAHRERYFAGSDRRADRAARGPRSPAVDAGLATVHACRARSSRPARGRRRPDALPDDRLAEASTRWQGHVVRVAVGEASRSAASKMRRKCRSHLPILQRCLVSAVFSCCVASRARSARRRTRM